MTAAIWSQVMSVITVNTATAITVRSAAHIVRCVIPRSVLAVHMNVPHAMNPYAGIVQPNAETVKKCFASIV